MRIRETLKEKIMESITAVVPITVIVFLLSISITPLQTGIFLLFLCGALMLILGMGLFTLGADMAMIPMGEGIGASLSKSRTRVIPLLVCLMLGVLITLAEPAVKVLTKQVEEVSNGYISQKSIEHSLSIGVALSVGLSMLRILLGISILWFLVPGYAISLLLSFLVPRIFTGIAFDSGGVASGPMTATFLLPLAMGACEALGGNLLTDAFGIVAMVAMTPLLTIQLLGLSGSIKSRLERKRLPYKQGYVEDCILYFDEEA